jgi:hypothetical protein
MPKQIGEWFIARDVFDAVETALVGKGGTNIHEYLQPDFVAGYGLEPGEQVLDLISKRQHDAVVLQVTCGRLGGELNADLQGAIDTYCEAARKAGSEPIIYEMGWTRENEQWNIGRKRCFEAAVRNKCVMVPCLTAWYRVWREKPELNLQWYDGAHPGSRGTYLNMCCFYAALTGKSPVGLPREIRVWGEPVDTMYDIEEEAVAAHEVAKGKSDTAVVRRRKQTVFVVPRDTARLSAEEAVYYQRVAWQCWLETQDQLRESGVDIRAPFHSVVDQ